MTVKEMIESGKPLKVSFEKKLEIATDPDYRKMNMQGGGTNGKYGYFIMNECGSDNVRSIIHKVDLESWETVATARDFYFGHANDIAFDTVNNRMIVSHCGPKISVFDPDTLELLEQTTVPTPHYALAYNKTRGIYVAGKSLCYDFALLDENFNQLGEFRGEVGYTKQGIECDDDYIYVFHSRKNANCLWIYDWCGALKARIDIDLPHESEHLFVHGDHFIAGFFNHTPDKRVGEIYEMRLYIEE